MKVAVIGNTANNGFSIMRYFRDLGVDAHLLLYTNDGVGPNAHFSPVHDTLDWEKWAPFVHQTEIANFPVSALDWPIDDVLAFAHNIYRWSRDEFFPTPSIRRSKIRSLLAPYDLLVGSGIAPAVCARIDAPLDIYYPYAIGVEWLGAPSFCLKYKWLLPFVRWTQHMQRKGIQAAQHVINADTSLARDVFEKMGVAPVQMAVPMIYNRETARQKILPELVDEIRSWMRSFDLTLFCSARMIWTAKSAAASGGSKNNHWLFLAMKKLKENRPKCRVGIALAEYGADLAATRTLIRDLGLEENVFWFPKVGRITLLEILKLCDVAVGQFYSQRNLIWGATGWEALATGRPLLQGFLFDEGGFEELFDMPPPPMLPVQTEEDILTHLLDMVDHPEKRKAIGEGAKEWFDRYNGIGLAKKWLDLLLEGETA